MDDAIAQHDILDVVVLEPVELLHQRKCIAVARSFCGVACVIRLGKTLTKKSSRENSSCSCSCSSEIASRILARAADIHGMMGRSPLSSDDVSPTSSTADPAAAGGSVGSVIVSVSSE